MKQRQSKEDREKRLADLRCPVHGTGLCQIDVDRMECPRRDCHIRFLFGRECDISAHFADEVLVVQAREPFWLGSEQSSGV